jgi:hypothetical protein
LDEFFIGNKNGKEKFSGMLIRVKDLVPEDKKATPLSSLSVINENN